MNETSNTTAAEVPFSVENYQQYVVQKQSHIVVTSHERPKPVRVTCVDRKNGSFPVLALLDDDGEEDPYTFTADGHVTQGGMRDGDLRIVPKPPVSRGWVVECLIDGCMSVSRPTLDELRQAVPEEYWLSEPVQLFARQKP